MNRKTKNLVKLIVFFAVIFFTVPSFAQKPTIEWVSIPAGTFTMGSPENEVERSKDENQHQILLNAFKMSKYEITFEQFDAFCEDTKREKPGIEILHRGKNPVVFVSWNDAKAFADWMGCRLPTEAEWEFACRAGTSTPFNTGKNLSTWQANYDGRFPYNNSAVGKYRDKTMPVGSFAPNEWGLYDMHGNVFEWCSDWYGEYPISDQPISTGPTEGTFKIFRGGSWYEDAQPCRSAYRYKSSPNARRNDLGFRLVSNE